MCHSLSTKHLPKPQTINDIDIDNTCLNFIHENKLYTYSSNETLNNNSEFILPHHIDIPSDKSYINSYIKNIYQIRCDILKGNYDKLDTFTIYPHPTTQLDYYKEFVGITLTIDHDDMTESYIFGICQYLSHMICFSLSVFPIVDDTIFKTMKDIPYTTTYVENDITPCDIYQMILTDLTFARYLSDKS
jgi:hypothetical protein